MTIDLSYVPTTTTEPLDRRISGTSIVGPPWGLGNVIPSAVKPRRIYVVCADESTNKYVAFDSERPELRTVAYSRAEAIANFVQAHCPELAITEIETA